MRVGDVFFVKRDSGYGSEWDGWPMVVESMESNRVTMRYQKRSDGEHNTITYDLHSLHEHLESL